jgi:hypothetical protein
MSLLINFTSFIKIREPPDIRQWLKLISNVIKSYKKELICEGPLEESTLWQEADPDKYMK